MPNPTQLEVWLQGFPREQVESRIKELETELAKLRQAMTLHDSFHPSSNGHTTADESSDAPPNRPDAIRRILRSGGNQPMTTAEIKDGVIKAGWIPDTPRDLKRFYSAVSTMAKRGHLLRLQDGRYMLPPNREALS